MADWFKVLSGFDVTKAVWHPKDVGAIFDWNKEWRDPELEEYLKGVPAYTEYAVGELKGLKRHFLWFAEDADTFMTLVGNKGWFMESEKYRKSILRSMQKHWETSVKNYWPNDGGKMTVPTHPAPGREAEGIQTKPTTVTFGPWLFWSESQWTDIERQWTKHCREQLRNALPTTEHIPSSHDIQSQKQTTHHSSDHQKRDKHRHKSRKKSRHHHIRHKSTSRSRSRSRSRDNHRPHIHHSHSNTHSPSNTHSQSQQSNSMSPIQSDDSQVSSCGYPHK